MGIGNKPLHGTTHHDSGEIGTEMELQKETEMGFTTEIETADVSEKKSRGRSILNLNEQHEQCRRVVSDIPKGSERAALNTANKEEGLIDDIESSYIKSSYSDIDIGNHQGALLERGSALHVGAKARRMFLHSAALLR